MSETALNRLKSIFEDIFRDRNRLIRMLLVIMILMLALILRVRAGAAADITVESEAGEAQDADICVDIGGAVVSPGVYTVSRDTRLYEVIEMAGGLLSGADTDSINQAEYVEDGEKIIIPVRLTAQDYLEQSDSEDPPASDGQDSLSQSEPQTMAAGLININYASKDELMTLSGIGESKADSIIEYRSSRRFRKKEDIKSVNGIGDAIYNKIKDSITV